MYTLGEKLHEGGRAAVYRAVRKADGHAVVLKVLDPKHCRPQDVQRLKNELALGRTLDGLSVLEPFGLATFEGRPALELEPFDGGSLEAIANAPMPVEAFLALAVRIAAAVADIHERGLVHKDLKPSNILVGTRAGEIKIADFGIASRVGREQTTLHPARLIEGSLPYVSPEQTGCMNRAIDSRSDLYALGVTFYQLLTGRLPFEATDPVGWIYCHVARKPPPPDEVRPALPAALSEIVLKLLAKVPDDRYQSAAGLKHDLERCLGAWRETGKIAPFSLGERDVSDRFLIPQKLYGRELESAALRAALERVADRGTSELVLVSGYSGIGKSAMVQDLQRSIVSRHGSFLAGKFEQFKRETPYFTIIQAFRGLVLDLLAESDSAIADWRERIQSALGQNGQLIVDLVPQVALVIGPQPPVPELPLTEAESRLHVVFRRFFGAFARPGRPLTVFVDDLQWADAASLKLLADLVADSDTRHLLLIGAHRDNDVDASHPLTRALDDVRKSGAVVRDLVLGPLSEASVAELVADTTHGSLAETAPLARLVREKTGGNPFFAIHFLTTLYRHGLIAFDRAAARWRWDVAKIRAQGFTDNVVDLMVGKLHDLPVQTQDALKLAAAIGATIDADALEVVMQRDPEPVLRAALEEDLLLRIDLAYRFPHDRVQEAAYSLIPDSERAAWHLRIGRMLLADTPPESLEERIFEIVNQLNRGHSLIASPGERERVAELNLVAGERAKASTACASALKYLALGSSLLAEDAWERRYDLAFALEFNRSECEYLTGAFDAAEERLAWLSRCAQSLADIAAVTCAQIQLFTTVGRSDQAVEACLEYLRRIGVDWSPHPTRDEVRREFDRIWRQVGSRPVEGLLHLPPMTDPASRTTIEVLTWAHSPACFTDENLMALVIGRMANLSLEHGNSDASCLAFVWLGGLLGSQFGDYLAGYRFGRVGLELVENRGLLRFKSRVDLVFWHLVNPWTKPFRTSLSLAHGLFDEALEASDITFASYARNSLITLLLAVGDPLCDAQLEAESALRFVQKAKFGLIIDVVTTQLLLIRTLRGLTPDFSTFNDAQFDEARYEQHLEAAPSLAIAACWYFVRKLQARFYAGDYRSALAAAARAEALLWTSPSFLEVAEYHFYAALARAAHHDEAPADERPRHRQALVAHLRKIEAWAESAPENFGNRAALVAAELARIDGEGEKAAQLYEQAIRSARQSDLVHGEALAYETASRFYRARGFDVFADTYLREAHDRYLRWGAEGKARQLERREPHLVERKPVEPATTMALRPEQLDLVSVVKASQTISGVMVRDQLVDTLLDLVLEESGARRAALVLETDGKLKIAAESTSEAAGPTPAPPLAPSLPTSILEYVQRTQERVLIDDAIVDAGRFSGDAYLARLRSRSVLCIPVRRQAEVVALLYLENELVPGAFTPERLLALELLAAQAAISLENAWLLEREHEGRVGAEAAGRRAMLLGEATALMSSTFDLGNVFDGLTHLCVRWLAEWAIIDVVEAGEVVRLAGAHRDRGKEPLLQDLAARYPARLDTNAPAATVLKTGAPVQRPDVSDEILRGLCVNDEHAALVGRLGTRSTVVVPLIARDVPLGALTLVSSSPHHFGPADVELAVELGRRAAMAIDNARLMKQTQRAVRLRDEFLSIASHELRTPLTSLQLAVESLRHVSAGRPLPAHTLDRNLSVVLRKTERLRQLTDQLFDVTALEKGQLGILPTQVELGTLVSSLVEHFALELATAKCPVSIDCVQPVVGMWDASRLEQLVTNLLANTIKFGHGRPIEIHIGKLDGEAELVIRDHGIGIDPARLPTVFERFERAVSWTHYGGLGLGLYIARSIVQAHGGTIRAESTLGEGTTITVRLPCAAPLTAEVIRAHT